MKRMSSGGFTIVESLIVLGITGVLFISLVGMVSAQQSKARFRAAMTDITTQLQSEINEVATGYFPNTNDIRCIPNNGKPRVLTGTNQQGTNDACTFLGKALMFAIPGTNPEEYRVHTLVGLRRTTGGVEPTTLVQAGVRPIAPGLNSDANYTSGWPNRSATKALAYGVTVAWMASEVGNIAGLAVVSAPNQQVALGQDGTAQAGTVIPSIIPIPRGVSAVPVGMSARAGVDQITRELGMSTGTADDTDGPIRICFRSGTTTQSGLVTIGRNNSTTAIDFIILNNTDCS